MIDKIKLILSNRDLYSEFLHLTSISIKTERSRGSVLPWTPETWPVGRGTLTAEQRLKAWCGSAGVYILNFGQRDIYAGSEYLHRLNSVKNKIELIECALPFFPNIVDKVINKYSTTVDHSTGHTFTTDKIAMLDPSATTKSNIKQEKKEMFKTQNKTVEAVVDANKEAVQIAGKLSVGRAANLTLLRKVTVKFPWYAKLFGKAKELENNPLAKLASAEVVIALSKHFAPENEKLKYLSEAMLQEAMVDVVTNSTQLESVINELTSLVPDNLFGTKTQ